MSKISVNQQNKNCDTKLNEDLNFSEELNFPEELISCFGLFFLYD